MDFATNYNLLSQHFVRLASFSGLINRTEKYTDTTNVNDSDCQHTERFQNNETVSVSQKTSFIKLARAGFYYGGPVEGIQCFKCKSKARYDYWDDESPVGVHRILNPYCPFLQSPDFDNNNDHNDLCASTTPTDAVASNHVGTLISQHPNKNAPQPQETTQREELSDNNHEIPPRNVTREISSSQSQQQSRNNIQRNLFLNIGTACNQLNENSETTVPNSTNKTKMNTNTSTLNNDNIRSRSSYFDHVEEYTGKIIYPKIGHTIFDLYESFRVLTFPTPQNEKAREWAEDGFIYVDNDIVQCVYCVGCASFYEVNVRDTHKRLFPEGRHLCPMVSKIDVGNVSIGLEALVRRKLLNKSNQPSAGCVTTYPVLHPQFMSTEERISSFKYWPKQYKLTKCQLAEAGFFHTGVATKVVCFCCGIAVIDWEPVAEPWQQHALISPTCCFIKHAKGPEFIQEMAAIENLVEVAPAVKGGRYPGVDMLKAAVLADGELKKHIDIIGLQDENIQTKDRRENNIQCVMINKDQHFKTTVASLNQECDLMVDGKNEELVEELEDQRLLYDQHIQQLNRKDQLLHLNYIQQLHCTRLQLRQELREKDDLSHQLQTTVDNLQHQLQTAEDRHTSRQLNLQQQLQTAEGRQLNLQQQLQIQQTEHTELQTQTAQLEAELRKYEIELSTQATELSRLKSNVRQNPDQENVTCLFCLSNERNVLLRPCKHVCCCVACAPHFNNSTCPTCRTPVQDWEVVFLP
ncbi:baculoviral IAP repeat-containing protein 3 [Patella vulgata]|uniref:baculoviral IAP repeat-containing protein 3 n=1 Tax=Patella vulgata TaxID=6465 RepID=UPI0024A85206|nr:baculoviral IAP repeat-containing protein 3 [Patella vulgata]